MKKSIKSSRFKVDKNTRTGKIAVMRLDWIKARRERMKLTQAEAAKLAGMSNPIQWQKVESGTIRDPQVSTVVRMATALRCNPLELLNWKAR